MDLNEITVFVTVVDRGSFVGAARELGMPKSTVSRRVTSLEERLGARLLHRTTRKLSLTDAGQSFYQHASRAVAAAAAAHSAVARLQEAPRGLLRVTAPLNFGYLSSVVVSFLKQHPEVQLELVCTDRVVDLIVEGFDVALRAGPLADSSLIARPVGAIRSYLVASPDFFSRHGEPDRPADLEAMDCVLFGSSRSARWLLHRDGKSFTVSVRARFAVNDFDFLDGAVLSGLGVAMVPIFRCIHHLREKRLVRVLPQYCSADIPLHAVYPSTRHLSVVVRAFLDHLKAQLTPPPWELGPLV